VVDSIDAVYSQEALRVRKRLVALKKGGVHRVKDKEPMPSAVHVVGNQRKSALPSWWSLGAI
jgi:hypothetical protein